MTETSTSPTDLVNSPLHDRHVALGAKFAPFGGWTMPLEYADGGVISEHTAVRERVGLFDVSHLGKVMVSGSGTIDFLNRCLTRNLERAGDGDALYTLCCDDNGGVVDDLIVYRFSADKVLLVPNAANNAGVASRLIQVQPEGIEIDNQHHDWAILAVQGPASQGLLERLGLPTPEKFMSFTEAKFGGTTVLVCRSGYTGEHGYELVVPSEGAGEVWDALVSEGSSDGIVPCGLAARDTLRLEMGYPLHGNELSAEISPVQARAGWAVGWKKDEFWGKDALVAEKEAGPEWKLWGLEATGRGVPRADMTVFVGDKPVGVTTSGSFSPTKKVGIALALLDTDEELGLEPGSEVEIEVRNRRLAAKVVKPPFVEAKTKS
ncbi:glycine cleavage system aminomethyltransferase GcvT [Natronoglycomyces albus]|uniref:Aminomethyltransferase n=1 Tax=Natronoglycomyces albus TaxID=2811108 RepID=A0A895XV02_9ACTN|nr:glycine cleavage system aminomethyltransferase GcvT [Natronoglycomyces albus]QSB06356.1 glycine cleavage system aminomethyltransferase GcvT [Natronoglycomyces albus]